LKVKENVLKQAFPFLNLIKEIRESSFVNLGVGEVGFQDSALFICKYFVYHTSDSSEGKHKTFPETEKEWLWSISCVQQQFQSLIFTEKSNAFIGCMIGISYSEKTSFQQESQIFLNKPVTEPTRVHNTRLFCTVLRRI
jgi:hypothetical protein